MTSNIHKTMKPVPDLYGSLRSPSSSPQIFAAKLQTWDILVGNEKCFNLHTGNVRYHEILDKVRPAYLNMKSKTAKKKMVRDVDDFIQGYGGRFLRVEEITDKLRIMTTAESRNKISRSLRDTPSQQKSKKIYVSKMTQLDVLCGRGKWSYVVSSPLSRPIQLISTLLMWLKQVERRTIT